MPVDDGLSGWIDASQFALSRRRGGQIECGHECAALRAGQRRDAQEHDQDEHQSQNTVSLHSDSFLHFSGSTRRGDAARGALIERGLGSIHPPVSPHRALPRPHTSMIRVYTHLVNDALKRV